MKSVSIIICSHNGVSRLPPLLGSLIRLKIYPNTEIELVFVDSASQDRTLDFVRNFGVPFALKSYRLSEPGQSKALNSAIEVSNGELLLFTDDDCQLGVDWLTAYVDAAANVSAAGYFFGRVVPKLSKSLPNWWDLAPRSMQGRDQGQDMIVYNLFCRESYPIGCNMALRRSALSGGLRFDEGLGPHPKSPTWLGADTKIGRDIQQSGIVGCYVPDAVVYHEVHPTRISWRYIVTHCWTSGRCSLYYKPSDFGFCRLRFTLKCLFNCITCAFVFMFLVMCGRDAKRSQLQLTKVAGVVWEYITTLGGKLR